MACPVTTVPRRIHSCSLLETESAYFEKLFQPTYQFRIIKRRGLAGLLPNGVKYVISLYPPTVEDEVLFLIMELSCPFGVRSWASKRERWGLPIACVGGQDELTEKTLIRLTRASTEIRSQCAMKKQQDRTTL